MRFRDLGYLWIILMCVNMFYLNDCYIEKSLFAFTVLKKELFMLPVKVIISNQKQCLSLKRTFCFQN